jgi:hypothetical protein
MSARPICVVHLLLVPIATNAAQEPPTLVLLGQDIVEAPGKKVGDLGISHHVRHSDHLGGSLFAVEDRTVDLADPAVLEVRDADLVLRKPSLRGDGGSEVLWRRPLAELGGLDAAAGRRLLTRDRIVLARANGLLALHRRDGTTAWEQKDCPQQTLLVDGDLVLAAGAAVDGEMRLGAFALANGAPAFAATLPGRAFGLAAAPHGVVAIGDGFVVGHDRTGPRLFARDGRVDRIAAHPDGWYTIAGTTAEALDRQGRSSWRVDLGDDHRGSRRLVVTAAGDLLVSSHCDISDSGILVQLRSRRDGGLLWSRDVAGLEVAHSKYRHDAYTTIAGAHVQVVSQGSAGAFLEQLELESGASLARYRR